MLIFIFLSSPHSLFIVISAILCSALVTAASVQDKSSSLLSTLAASLLSSFSPSEVISPAARKNCTLALLDVVALSKAGYISGDLGTSKSLANVVSAYIVQSTTVGTKRRLSISNTVYPVTQAVDGLIHGVQLGMVSGEDPVSLVSTNVQITLSNTLSSGNSQSVFTTPATASQLVYGTIPPKITLGPHGFSSCKLAGGYSQVSVLQWAVNPYPLSTDVRTSLFRISATSEQGPTAARVKTMVNESSSVPAYTIALQFSTAHNFTTSATQRRNQTIPVCTLYDGMAYVPCKGCNVSSYTDYNVTYSCFDITQLCPTTVSLAPTKAPITYPLIRSNSTILAATGISPSTGILRKKDVKGNSSRFLRYVGSHVVEEDQSINRRMSEVGAVESSTDVSEAPAYGALFNSVKQELINVLTSNPFKLNLKTSTTLLSFVGLLGGFIIISLVYLLRLDQKEKLFKTYVKKDADEVTRKFEANIKRGDNGVIEVRTHLIRVIFCTCYSVYLVALINFIILIECLEVLIQSILKYFTFSKTECESCSDKKYVEFIPGSGSKVSQRIITKCVRRN